MTKYHILLKGDDILKRDEQIRLYAKDVAILKDYGIKRKITILRSVRNKGFEVEQSKMERGTANDEKLENNIIRTRSTIFELAYCNPWDLFVSLTIDSRLFERYDLNKYQKQLTKWISNYNVKYQIDIKYLLIPEMHLDGAWHMHGFLMGLPEDHLTINEHGYLDWLPYREKFGWFSGDIIRSHERVAKYVTKYISKALMNTVKELNAHMYYCSSGLARATEIKRGTLIAVNVPWDYENDWCKCKWSEASSQDLAELIVT